MAGDGRSRFIPMTSGDCWRPGRASSRVESQARSTRLRRSDGAYRWFLFRVQPFHNGIGRVARWYGTAADIEDRKRAESLRAIEKHMLEMTPWSVER